jgi:CheY-like chemotaxis protein
VPRTLLLADDSLTIQRVIELTFADEDVRVVAVGDGRKAVDAIKAQPPDIVLADVGMPEMDGYEVAAFVKGSADLAHIPVVLLTGAFEPIDEGRARSAGCDGVLVKPFEPQMVIGRVKDLLGRQGQKAEAASSQTPAVRSAPSASPAPDLPAAPAAAAAGQPAAAPDVPSKALTDGGSPASIDEYFDRLDAVFAVREGTLPRQPEAEAGLADELAQWSPEGPGASEAAARRRSVTPAAPPRDSVAQDGRSDPQPIPAQSTGGIADEGARLGPVSLAEAFGALLAAEEGRPLATPAAQRLATSETFLEQITRLVVERIGERMRETVVDVAERVVREEIERIKASAR